MQRRPRWGDCVSFDISSEYRVSRQTESPSANNRSDLAKGIRVGISNAQAVTLPTLVLDAIVIIITSVVTSVGYNLIAFGIFGDIYASAGAGCW